MTRRHGDRTEIEVEKQKGRYCSRIKYPNLRFTLTLAQTQLACAAIHLKYMLFKIYYKTALIGPLNRTLNTCILGFDVLVTFVLQQSNFTEIPSIHNPIQDKLIIHEK